MTWKLIMVMVLDMYLGLNLCIDIDNSEVLGHDLGMDEDLGMYLHLEMEVYLGMDM